MVKPLRLSGSRGVIRANTPDELVAAVTRLGRILLDDGNVRETTDILVEDFIPGVEVALDGLLREDGLHVLALFDKPDPLDGPFFEETIYTTPSRLPRGAGGHRRVRRTGRRRDWSARWAYPRGVARQ